MDYQIVRYRPEFRQQVVELLGHLKGRDEAVNSAYFEWKYERNPYLSPPLGFVALHDGRVVATRSILGVRWEACVPDQMPRCLSVADLVVAPEHRRRGIYKLVAEAVRRDLRSMGCSYLINTSARPVNFRASLKMGWRSPGPYLTLRRESGRAVLGRKLRRAANRVPVLRRYAGDRPFPLVQPWPNPFQIFDQRAARRDVANPKISIASAPRAEEMAALIARIGTDGRIRHVRDTEYLVWRYQDPHYLFRFIFWEDDRLEGFLVLQARPDQGRAEATIVDWEASASGVGAALLDAALALGIDTLSVWSATFDPEKTTLLRDREFRPFDESQGFADYRPGPLVFALDPAKPEAEWRVGERNLLDVSDWDIRGNYHG